MPLRDHFRPPVDKKASWEGFHGMWPGNIVRQLHQQLPPGYVAEPRVHLGSFAEVDVATFEEFETLAASPLENGDGPLENGDGGVAVWAPARPSLAVETELLDWAEYEVLVFDLNRDRQLVAAIELVSPTNKDRPEHRNVFVAKCAALLQRGVAVSVVDIVTVRHFNLYAELLALIGLVDLTLGEPPPHLYAAACRLFKPRLRPRLEAWSHRLVLGQPLPTLPLWLSEDLAVPLNLEQSYEQACRDLRIA